MIGYIWDYLYKVWLLYLITDPIKKCRLGFVVSSLYLHIWQVYQININGSYFWLFGNFVVCHIIRNGCFIPNALLISYKPVYYLCVFCLVGNQLKNLYFCSRELCWFKHYRYWKDNANPRMCASYAAEMYTNLMAWEVCCYSLEKVEFLL
jgi:hypothetical protein